MEKKKVTTEPKTEKKVAAEPKKVEPKKSTTYYTAKGGETLAYVAGKYGTTAAKLAEANKLDKNVKLEGGQQVAL